MLCGYSTENLYYAAYLLLLLATTHLINLSLTHLPNLLAFHRRSNRAGSGARAFRYITSVRLQTLA